MWSFHLWNHIHKRRLDLELSRNPRLKVSWEIMKTKRVLQNAINQLEQNGFLSLHQKTNNFLDTYDNELHNDPVSAIKSAYELICEIQVFFEKKGLTLEDPIPEPSSQFFPILFNLYFSLLQSPENPHSLVCCQEIVSLICDLLSQLSTRRYLCVFVKDSHFVAKTRLSALFVDSNLQSLLQRLVYYLQFDMDSGTGTVYSREEQNRSYYKKMLVFQNILFK